MLRLQTGDLAGLLVLLGVLVFFFWLGAAKRQLERRRQRVPSSFR
jgi:hypothetical protein